MKCQQVFRLTAVGKDMAGLGGAGRRVAHVCGRLWGRAGGVTRRSLVCSAGQGQCFIMKDFGVGIWELLSKVLAASCCPQTLVRIQAYVPEDPLASKACMVPLYHGSPLYNADKFTSLISSLSVCASGNAKKDFKKMTPEEWKKHLTPQQYYVTREAGTEPAFTGEFYDHHEKGMYLCVCCGSELFSSEAKYDSGSGWPSFHSAAGKVSTHTDRSFLMVRTEVLCGECNAHLGHVFPDGPEPTGLRYCINSLSLKFSHKM